MELCTALPSSSSATPTSSVDTGKKKRVYRAAKLKQCKMDARREQWLSKGKWNVEGLSPSHRDKAKTLNNESDSSLEASRRRPKHIGYGSSGENSPENMKEETPISPDSCHSLPLDCPPPNHRNGVEGKRSEILAWSASDTSSIWSSSSHTSSNCDGSVSDDEKVDDWEAVADALQVQASLSCETFQREGNKDGNHVNNGMVLSHSVFQGPVLKPESRYGRSVTIGVRTRTSSRSAWQPDDASRPHTLPCLSKQHSLSSVSMWNSSHMRPAPSHCPICIEELDHTDSSFMPCPCGFRLCLFCHNRILSMDGRCPACRKTYDVQITKQACKI